MKKVILAVAVLFSVACVACSSNKANEESANVESATEVVESATEEVEESVVAPVESATAPAESAAAAK